jgi:hypothetical protein
LITADVGTEGATKKYILSPIAHELARQIYLHFIQFGEELVELRTML